MSLGSNIIEIRLDYPILDPTETENYNKARSACIIIEILWTKMKYDIILNSPNLTAHVTKSGVGGGGFVTHRAGIKKQTQYEERKEKPNVFTWQRKDSKLVFNMSNLALTKKKNIFKNYVKPRAGRDSIRS